MNIKNSNQFLASFGLLTLIMIGFTNFNLVREYKKIDLSDPFKNYLSMPSIPHSVLKFSGSNGYPIEIRYSDVNTIKVLRSRVEHVHQNITADTLYIDFTGANISKNQSQYSNTPPAIVLQRNVLPEIIISDIHCKIADFDAEELRLTVKGNALCEIKDCHLNTMNVEVSNNGHLEFFHENSVRSLQLAMRNTSSAYLKNVNLHHIEQDLTDSVSIILSNDVFNALVK